MSSKKQQRREEQEAQAGRARGILLRRRVMLAAYLVCLVLTVIGAEVGPWWETWVGEKKVGETMVGKEFLRHRKAGPPPDADPMDPLSKYRVVYTQTPAPLMPAHLMTLLCVVAFLIASYDLVADRDIQLPTFLLTLGVTATAAYVAYLFWADNAVIAEVLDLTLREETRQGAASAGKTAAASAPARELPRVVPRWGFALFLAAAPGMFISSTYLTFVADRGRNKETPTP